MTIEESTADIAALVIDCTDEDAEQEARDGQLTDYSELALRAFSVIVAGEPVNVQQAVWNCCSEIIEQRKEAR